MRRIVGPFQIIERQNQFQVRKGRTIHCTHSSYLNAEDKALSLWLGPEAHDDDFEDEYFLATEQTVVVRAAAASIPSCWKERFLASVQEHLLRPRTRSTDF